MSAGLGQLIEIWADQVAARQMSTRSRHPRRAVRVSHGHKYIINRNGCCLAHLLANSIELRPIEQAVIQPNDELSVRTIERFEPQCGGLQWAMDSGGAIVQCRA